MLFPKDFLIEIARSDQWETSGPLARTSKEILCLFTDPNILREIMESVKIRQRPLFKWMLLALPSCYFTIPSEKRRGIDSLLSSMLVDSTPYLSPDIPSGSQFICGDMVCQHVYEKKWASSIDIYAPCEYTKNGCYISQDIMFTIYATETQNPERVIESFDISIVQQGILGTDYFLTPLAFYTQCWQEIVVTPDYSKLKSPGDINDHETWNHTFWDYTVIHVTSHEKSDLPFHNCKACAYMRKLTMQITFLMSWTEKVCQYKERFESFSIVYCKPPPICNINVIP